MRMFEIEVCIKEGLIEIYQRDRETRKESSILLSPEQAEVVCDWIKSAKNVLVKRD